jgi:hypothetical protein
MKITLLVDNWIIEPCYNKRKITIYFMKDQKLHIGDMQQSEPTSSLTFTQKTA